MEQIYTRKPAENYKEYKIFPIFDTRYLAKKAMDNGICPWGTHIIHKMGGYMVVDDEMFAKLKAVRI